MKTNTFRLFGAFSFLILYSISGILNSPIILAQEYTGHLPLASVKEPPQSLFRRTLQLIALVEPPLVLIFKKSAVVVRNKTPLKKELKTMAFRHPLSLWPFFSQYEKFTTLIFRLVGLTPRQAQSMSVFCFGTLAYEGSFAQQIILKVLQSGINGDSEPCMAAVEYEEQLKEGIRLWG